MIEAVAPVRICDIGGWTDTWFGGPGRVLNIAVTPGVQVTVTAGSGPGRVVLDLPSFGDRYEIYPGVARVPRHPLIEAAVDACSPPSGADLEIRVTSAMPPGSGCGTSAAVAVAMLGALTAVRSDEEWGPRRLAREAHRLEVDVLAGESGVQDQLCSAVGGLCYLEIESYPEVELERLPPWDDLGELLTVVYLGRAHNSSAVHRQVIDGASSDRAAAFSQLRSAAEAARRAVVAQDLGEFGDAMIANTSAQGALHPALVGFDARRVIETAGSCGAIGWKVNGAGGEGGSVTLLSPGMLAKADLERAVAALDPKYEVLPIRMSGAGLQVQETK